LRAAEEGTDLSTGLLAVTPLKGKKGLPWADFLDNFVFVLIGRPKASKGGRNDSERNFRITSP